MGFRRRLSCRFVSIPNKHSGARPPPAYSGGPVRGEPIPGEFSTTPARYSALITDDDTRGLDFRGIPLAASLLLLAV